MLTQNTLKHMSTEQSKLANSNNDMWKIKFLITGIWFKAMGGLNNGCCRFFIFRNAIQIKTNMSVIDRLPLKPIFDYIQSIIALVPDKWKKPSPKIALLLTPFSLSENPSIAKKNIEEISIPNRVHKENTNEENNVSLFWYWSKRQ